MKLKLTITLFLIILLPDLIIAQDYDLIIENATIYNGTDDKPKVEDIGISKDEIVFIGDLRNKTALKKIDVGYMAVSPGFIDTHAHIENIKELPAAESALKQGVTFLLGGADGGGPADFSGHLDSISNIDLGVNIGYQVGHNSVRKRVMGTENRSPTKKELNRMKKLVSKAMENGAFGLSTGLAYVPGIYSDTEEVITLATVAAYYGGFYSSHIRNESLDLIKAVEETIEIAGKADITAVISHHKALGASMWGESIRTLKMIDSANTGGLDIWLDQYPYTASSTGISALIPAWAREGGTKNFRKRLQNDKLRDSIEKGILFKITKVRVGTELNRLQFREFKWKPELQGKTMEDWLKLEGLKPTPVNAVDLIIQAQLNGGATMIYHVMHEDDVNRIMAHPRTMIASDGKLSQPGKNHPHPRSYGTFPRVLGRYVRENNIISLSEAIKKMTSMPASLLGLNNRGQIKEGFKADIVIFDPKQVIDLATFEEPHQYPTGIKYVIINGQVCLQNNRPTGVTPGQLVKSSYHKL